MSREEIKPVFCVSVQTVNSFAVHRYSDENQARIKYTKALREYPDAHLELRRRLFGKDDLLAAREARTI